MTPEQARKLPHPDQFWLVYWRDPDGREPYVKRPVRRGDIPGLFDETFFTAIAEWKSFKLFGLPHGGGPLGERSIVTQAISIVEAEKNFFEVASIEEKKRNTPSGSRGT